MEPDRPAVSSLPEEELPAYQVARRKRIVDAARSLLEKQEYEQIQIRDVAAAAGFALGTVYRYFSSKEHLYAAVLHAWGSDYDRASVGYQADDDPMRRLEQRMRSVLASFERRPQFFRALILLMSSNDPNAKAYLSQFRESIEGLVEADLAKLDPDGAAEYSVLVWSVLSSLLTRSVIHEFPMAEAYRVNDRMIELLRLRFGHDGS
ncbi:TetR/AcrR family transcriptional regulator [Frankia sp. CNm7]|uniref:TetR/AcrR family transcriptional regulator n=1 Tax=Frankia nepalensis TaxID=1836974 RepID=A0A937RRL4_9ACTN|nr:TetR/AcrR family transcriptional regulator [Frankia nepalensis]MBL7499562.1 TetR/AcrR family transcriptional regulator [Frankia nepalensis]MBL7513190.1 TetR/AcrR family transcriptional regulator [Frankia nepalensis]MBL7517583.1 TetR/AcrR family transcriptional regulator [Frankia nepalensis]MBL7633670.1 TetR/AcrR family transcriptional regulator [Frankia nepalensis]